MTAATTNTAIEIRGLTKHYGEVKALDGLDLHVPAGSVFGFLGPNGAGKTTALSILAGLSHSSSGEATISGLDVEEQGMQVRQRIRFLAPGSSVLHLDDRPRNASVHRPLF